MIGSLIRWFGRAAATRRSRRGPGSARPFTSQLEVLEGRAVPAAFFGAGALRSATAQTALLGAAVSGPAPVTPLGSKAGGAGDGVSGAAVLGANVGGGQHVAVAGSSARSGGGEVTPFGAKLGLAGGSNEPTGAPGKRR
jgi:hypothetical protein